MPHPARLTAVRARYAAGAGSRAGLVLMLALAFFAPAACVIVPASKPGAPLPVSRPADPAATSSSRIRFTSRPLGRVSYDGLCPPIIAPAGDFLAVQQGRAPTWPTLLAQDQAEPPLGTTLAIYRISASAVQPYAPPTPAPPALLLGRSADPAGFLVEAPQPGGSRWIGRIEWVSGDLTWLVRTNDVNAHAALSPRGDLVFTRRAVGSARAELVLHRAADVRELTLADAGGAYVFPTFADDPTVFAAFALLPGGMEVVLIRVPDGAERSGSLTILGRHWLCASAALITAYQAISPLQTPLPLRARRATDPASPISQPPPGALAFFHPALGRMAVIDSQRSEVIPLLAGSFAAVPVLDGSSPPQYLQSTHGGVALGPPGLPLSTTRAAAAVSVLPGPSIARATTKPDLFILVGPAPESSEYQCEISVLHLAKPE